MDIIMRFEQPMSNFEFLALYENIDHKSLIPRLISANLKVHFNILKRYMECYRLNDNQKYVLCKHLFYISKFMRNDLEMKILFYSKLNFFVKQIQENQNDTYNLRFWIYRICLNILIEETDLQSYNQMLLICTEFFTNEKSEIIKSCMIYTFADERFLHSMTNMYKKYNTSLTWEYTGFLLLDFMNSFITFIAQHVDDFHTVINIKFSPKYIKFLFILLNENELDIWYMSFYQMSIISHWLTDYKYCQNIFTENNVHKIIQFISHIEPETQKCQIAQLFLQTINNITNYDVIIDTVIIEYIYKFMFSLNYSIDYYLIDELLIFITLSFRKYENLQSNIKQIISFINDIVYNHNIIYLANSLLSAILILVAKKHIGYDKLLFQTIYENGLTYSIDTEGGLRFIYLMLLWLKLSFKHNWNFNEIVKNDISILDNGTEPNLIYHIKTNLVYTSLFDKCKFKIYENKKLYSNNDLELFNYFIK